MFDVPRGEIKQVGRLVTLFEAEGQALGFNSSAGQDGPWAVICCAPYGAPYPSQNRPKSLVRNGRFGTKRTA